MPDAPEDGGTEHKDAQPVQPGQHGVPKPPHDRRARRREVEEHELWGETGYSTRLAAKWGVHIRTIRQDVAHVKRMWAAQGRRAAKSRLDQAIKRYERMLRMAVAAGQLGEAARIQARIDKIAGLEHRADAEDDDQDGLTIRIQ